MRTGLIKPPRGTHGLYLLTPECRSATVLMDQVNQALTAGVGMLQFRDKCSSPEEKLSRAEALRKLTRQHNIPLIINDDPALAERVGADGVHLGEDDVTLSAARKILGPQAIIGVSCYNSLERAARLAEAGADYLAFGRVFTSLTKPKATACDLAVITAARERFGLPVVAIGGISPDNARQVISAGAHWLAVVESVFGADDIATACEQLSETFLSSE